MNSAPRLPSGFYVNGNLHYDERDQAHAPAVVAERIAYFAEHFPVGAILRRDDHCVMKIDSLSAPSWAGYVTAYSHLYDPETGKEQGARHCWQAPLATSTRIG